MAINKEMTNEDLLEALKAQELEYIKLKFDHTVTPLANPTILSAMRKDIARAKTELRARDLAAATPAELAKRSKIRARRKK